VLATLLALILAGVESVVAEMAAQFGKEMYFAVEDQIKATIPSYDVVIDDPSDGRMWLHTSSVLLLIDRWRAETDPLLLRRFGNCMPPNRGLVRWHGHVVLAEVRTENMASMMRIWAPTHWRKTKEEREARIDTLRAELVVASRTCTGGMLLVRRACVVSNNGIMGMRVREDDHDRDELPGYRNDPPPRSEVVWASTYHPVDGVILRDELDDRLLAFAKRYFETSKDSHKARRVCAVLLVGAPGAGKTSRAQRLAYDLGQSLVVGDTSIVSHMSSRSRASQTAVEFIDEIDRDIKSCPPREQHARIRDLLTYLDGAANRGATVLVAACNSTAGMDPALLRRFHVITVDPPGPEKFWRLFADNYGLAADHKLRSEVIAAVEPLRGKVTLRELTLHMRWYDDPEEAAAKLSQELAANYSYAT
jgi:hypothetical protein